MRVQVCNRKTWIFILSYYLIIKSYINSVFISYILCNFATNITTNKQYA